MADDLGAECLGCYGGTSYTTPHLDGLASSGVRFTHCNSTPLCSPSRVQVMTGRYPFRTGWPMMINQRPKGQQYLDPKERTFGHVLKAGGYATALAGKWQLCHFDERPDHVRQCGFDDSCCWAWRVNGTRTKRYWTPAVWQDGRMRDDVADRYGPDVFCEFLIDAMTRNRSRPFMAYYPMTLVHSPFVPTPDTKRRQSTPKGSKARQQNFADMVAYMDKLIGRLVAALDRLKLREKTLIMFTGDNGTHRAITSKLGGTSIITGGKGKMTEAGTHVPLIANWHGTTPAGKVCDDLIDFSDMMPTFVELAGAPLPQGVTIDGRSFAPQLLGQKGKPRDWAYCRLREDRWVRDKRWRLRGNGTLVDLQGQRYGTKPTYKPGQNEPPEANAARKRLQAVLDTLE
jgi:arylsulfatase A-like enzyme